MEVVILSNADAVASHACQLVTELVTRKSDAVLGLATGSTPLALYKLLIAQHQNQGLSFADVSSFNLDEYIGLDAASKQSYQTYMRQSLFDQIDIAPENTHLPSCAAGENPHAAGALYEQKITEKGGLDLQVLGIGANGHIGFNEPSSSFGSRTRVKTLAEQTLIDNSRLFAADEFQPQLAMTMGIATILDAKRVLLLATGANKAAAVAKMIEGAISAKCPATSLQLHQSVTVLLDEDAAVNLEDAAYYRWVHEQNLKLNQVHGTRLDYEWQS